MIYIKLPQWRSGRKGNNQTILVTHFAAAEAEALRQPPLIQEQA
jgi:hypothetical protein